MPLQCGECYELDGKTKDRKVIQVRVVCHHCGKPLCQEHWFLIADDAFSENEARIQEKAFHCEECLKTYHPYAVPILSGGKV